MAIAIRIHSELLTRYLIWSQDFCNRCLLTLSGIASLVKGMPHLDDTDQLPATFTNQHAQQEIPKSRCQRIYLRTPVRLGLMHVQAVNDDNSSQS